jgi:YYY domain-containing protein
VSMSDAIAVFVWWVLAQIFGLVGLPVAFRLFRRLPDRGYGLSKALGLLLASYVYWLLGVLGFLHNSTGAMLFSLAATAIASVVFYSHLSASNAGTPDTDALDQDADAEPRNLQYTPAPTLSSWLRDNWRLVLIAEIIFAVTFAGWALYRAYVPRIMTAGGEKFMELAFLNGIGRSETLPPLDPWLSGYAISYYYFGYLMMSVLIRLSGVAASVGFNIGGALLFALTATGAFSLVYNLVASLSPRRPPRTEQDSGSGVASEHRSSVRPKQKWVWIALLGAVFVVLLANFEGPLEVAHWKGIGSEKIWSWLDIADLDRPAPAQFGEGAGTRFTRPGWWWWRASRVVFDYDVADWPNRYDKAADPAPQRRENIDEFPFFSFLLGDMHPHVLALPFVILALTVSLSLYLTGYATGHTFEASRFSVPGLVSVELLLFALALGALGFLNTWDFPIQWVVAVAAYGLGRLSGVPAGGSATRSAVLRRHVRPIFALAAVLAIGGLGLYVPFYIGFQSQAGGPLVHVHSPTRLAQFLVMFGPLLLILTVFLLWGLWRAKREQALEAGVGLRIGAILLLLALALLLVTAVAIVIMPEVRELVAPALMTEEPTTVALRYLSMRLGTPWVSLLLVGMIAAATALLFFPGFGRLGQFALLLIIAGAGMALLPDYVYLKDVFGVRLNTVFKFYFQTWVLWSVSAAAAVYIMLVAPDGLKSTARWLFSGALVIVVGLGLVYPLLAIPDRIKEFPEAPTLDGTAYLAQEQAADYAAAQWLNSHVKGAPVILETPGGAYQYEGRVSVQTGLPTLLGWAGHEHQWRGNTVEQDKRFPVIQELCSTTDAERTLTLLNEYDINYVYVGPLERTKCPQSGLQKFDRLMDTVYDRDGVTIYRRREALGGRFGE